MIEIYDFCYFPHNGLFRCCGRVINHPRFPPNHFVFPSIPVVFSEEDLTFNTQSGSHYHIMSFEGDREECLMRLRENVSCGRFESYRKASD